MTHHRSSRKINWFILGFVGLAIFAFGDSFWAANLVDSAKSYRSPLANNPPLPGKALSKPVSRHLVIVLIDALRYDTSINIKVMPFLNGLRAQGASAIMHSKPPSFSAPGWTTLFSGAWPEINDSQIFNPTNVSSARTFTQDNIFSAAQRIGLNTAVSGYVWLQGMLSNSGVDAGFYTNGEDNNADDEVMAASLPWLSGDFQLVLVHLDQVDFAGHHEGGPRNPNWNAAASRTDQLLSQIVARLNLTLDTVLVISDHGQIDRGGHGGPEPVTLVEPFVLVGNGVIHGNYGDMNMVDVAPTIAVLLGTNIPASNQGHVLVDMLKLTSEQNVTIQNALKAQQSQLLEAYIKAIGVPTNIGGGEIVSATQAGMNLARITRLGNERIWRNVVVAFLVILPGYSVALRRKKSYVWLIAGSFINLLIFYLRYAVIDRRTFSLSSIQSSSSFIIYVVSTSVIAFIIGGLVPIFGMRALNAGVQKAIETILLYIWFSIYLLALPILLSFAINGFIVNWTLPEFYSLFIGLISLIQSIIVSVLGFLLVGVLVIIGYFRYLNP